MRILRPLPDKNIFSNSKHWNDDDAKMRRYHFTTSIEKEWVSGDSVITEYARKKLITLCNKQSDKIFIDEQGIKRVVVGWWSEFTRNASGDGYMLYVHYGTVPLKDLSKDQFWIPLHGIPFSEITERI